ncbi:hypothetical protein MJN76_34760, partial [Salmonella enterica subsp. enterica serovar Anatum]|nr:hypothetical protein [Salmonella enterica subsp. enterica serovar Anatum]
NDEKVIFLVPHGWGVDIPAMLMASQGQKMAAMFHNQGNPVFEADYQAASDHLNLVQTALRQQEKIERYEADLEELQIRLEEQ